MNFEGLGANEQTNWKLARKVDESLQKPADRQTIHPTIGGLSTQQENQNLSKEAAFSCVLASLSDIYKARIVFDLLINGFDHHFFFRELGRLGALRGQEGRPRREAGRGQRRVQRDEEGLRPLHHVQRPRHPHGHGREHAQGHRGDQHGHEGRQGHPRQADGRDQEGAAQRRG